jgi:hypothetical protein
MNDAGDHRPETPESLVRGDAVARFARRGDEDAIVALMLSSFDGWPPFAIGGTPREFLDWYFEPHSTTHGISLVVVIDGRIASASTRILRPALVGGMLHPARLGGYVATSPDFRGRGAYRLLSDFGNRQPQDFAWHLTQVAEVMGITERRGFRALGNPFEVYVAMIGLPGLDRPVRPKGLAKAAGYGGVALWGAARRLRRPAIETCSVRRVTDFDVRVDELWKRAAYDFYFIPLRDAEFLNWRYCDPRAGSFTVCIAEEGSDLLGYVVLRTDKRRAHLVDMLVDPRRNDALQLLSEIALQESRAAGADSVECWLFGHHPYRDALERAGFVRFPARSKRLARQVRIESFGIDRSSIAYLDSPLATIHLMEGDTDLT